MIRARAPTVEPPKGGRDPGGARCPWEKPPVALPSTPTEPGPTPVATVEPAQVLTSSTPQISSLVPTGRFDPEVLLEVVPATRPKRGARRSTPRPGPDSKPINTGSSVRARVGRPDDWVDRRVPRRRGARCSVDEKPACRKSRLARAVATRPVRGTSGGGHQDECDAAGPGGRSPGTRFFERKVRDDKPGDVALDNCSIPVSSPSCHTGFA